MIEQQNKEVVDSAVQQLAELLVAQLEQGQIIKIATNNHGNKKSENQEDYNTN